jgi:DNA-binding PadR family transcriptional regulator
MLALLDENPSYGYELKANFESTVGPQWGGLNIGHVYQILERLRREELITVLRKVVLMRRPDRTVYKVTARGQAELRDWLDKPATRSAGQRDEFVLKILAASARGPDAVRGVCEIQRAARVAELAALRKMDRTKLAGPLARLTVDAAILHTQADLKLVDAAEERADTAGLALNLRRAGDEGVQARA